MKRAKVQSNEMGPTRSITTQVPTSAYEAFDKLAVEHELTKSQLMRTLVLDALYRATSTEPPCAGTNT